MHVLFMYCVQGVDILLLKVNHYFLAMYLQSYINPAQLDNLSILWILSTKIPYTIWDIIDFLL